MSDASASRPLPRFVAIGEALTDLIRVGPDAWVSKVGGAPWNAARVLAALGVPSAFAGAISNDVFGDALWHASAAAGLDLRFLQRVDRSPLLAIVHRTDPVEYFFVGDDSADLHFDASELPTQWQRQAQWAHFGGISLVRQPLADRLMALATELSAAGVRISYDPNFRALMTERYQATLRYMTAVANVVKISDDDLCGLFGTRAPDSAFRTLRSWNESAVYLYTRGAAGASLHVGDRVWHARPPAVEIVDTVGAGDASLGGLLFSMMTRQPDDWSAHVRFAVAAGAAACVSAGAVAPSLQAIEALCLDTGATTIDR